MVPSRRLPSWSAAVLLGAAVLCCRSSRAEEPARFALQAGWWNLEADYSYTQGLYVAFGVPWIVPVGAKTLHLEQRPIGIQAKVGMQFKASEHFRFRVGLQDVTAIFHYKFGDTVDGKSFSSSERPMQFISATGFTAGVRYEHPSGFIAGLDIPMFGVAWEYITPRVGGYYLSVSVFPATFYLSQLYIGYSFTY